MFPNHAGFYHAGSKYTWECNTHGFFTFKIYVGAYLRPLSPYTDDTITQMKLFSRLTLSLAILLISAVCGGNAFAQDGSTAYNYLNVTQSSRIYALGGVNITAVEDELSVTDQNPALLGPEMSNQILVDYMRYMGGSNFAGVRYAHSATERGAWSAGIRYFGYGKMTEADEFGNITGSFSPKDVNFSGSFSYDITDRLRGGIALKMLYNSYEAYSAFAIGVDLGINYYNPDSEWSASAVVANLGGQLKRFNETHDRLPIDIRLGVAKMFSNIPIRFSVTAWNLTKWHLPYYKTGDGTQPLEEKDSFMSNLFRHLVFGVDFIPNERFYVALGYNYKTRTDMSTYQRSFFSGFSLGAGMNLRRFSFGLAFAQPHSGATTLMLNLNMNLNELLN